MVNPLYNHREKRLRAFWRLLFQFALNAVGLVLAGGLALVLLTVSEETGLGGDSAETLAASPASLAIGSMATFVVTVGSMWLAGRFFDHRPFSGFGMQLDRSWWLDFCFGLALGVLLMAGIFFMELAAGWIAVTGTFEVVDRSGSFALAILVPLVTFVCVGFYEELMSRGYQLTNMAEGLNYPSLGPRGAILLAWVLSSSLFGLLHLANPNATITSSIIIAFAGLLLGAGYVLTGRLAIPIGLHITWNFFEGNVFGFPVSGIEPIGATFISIEQGGPLLFTGGVFGPEDGLLGLAATIVGSLLIWLWVRARSGKATLETSIAEPPIGRNKPTQENPPDTLAPGNGV
ncbi:MAG: protease family protein [Rubrobacteraceae bacterium]|nr:protease family protein [Rubrobacteraceae bacterium]